MNAVLCSLRSGIQKPPLISRVHKTPTASIITTRRLLTLFQKEKNKSEMESGSMRMTKARAEPNVSRATQSLQQPRKSKHMSGQDPA